jgi:hypothetical protein
MNFCTFDSASEDKGPGWPSDVDFSEPDYLEDENFDP